MNEFEIIEKINRIMRENAINIEEYDKMASYYWTNGALYVNTGEGKFALIQLNTIFEA